MRHKPSLLTLILLALAAGACAPKVGTPEWCAKLQEKPKGDWTANEAGDFLKHCLVPGTEAPK
jgi:DUF3012 family protein